MADALRLAALCAVSLLTACAAPGADLAAARESWQGASYEDVVRAWGAPARSTTLPDGREAHTWANERVTSRGMVYPSIGVFGGSGNVGVGVGVGTSAPFGQGVERCERTLIFWNDRVVDEGDWNGADTFCATFRR